MSLRALRFRRPLSVWTRTGSRSGMRLHFVVIAAEKRTQQQQYLPFPLLSRSTKRKWLRIETENVSTWHLRTYLQFSPTFSMFRAKHTKQNGPILPTPKVCQKVEYVPTTTTGVNPHFCALFSTDVYPTTYSIGKASSSWARLWPVIIPTPLLFIRLGRERCNRHQRFFSRQQQQKKKKSMENPFVGSTE